MNHARNLVAHNADLTPEVMDRVDNLIAEYRNKPGSLIPVLEECQEMIGYIPLELQDYIALGMNIPGSTIYGVVTFYSFFSMVPKGRHTIKVCLGTACYVRGMRDILDRICSEGRMAVGQTTADRRFTLQAVRCLGACGLAPVMVVDNDTYGGVTPDSAMKILERYQ